MPSITLLRVVGLEATQSTQYHSADGTGAGADNSVSLITGKPLMVRVYLESRSSDLSSVVGRLSLMAFNDSTLKYDILRRRLDPLRAVTLQPSSRSRRRDLDETLNFLVPAGDCHGRVRLDAVVWVSGHESDSHLRDDGVLTASFQATVTPIIHCFRINFSRSVPSMSHLWTSRRRRMRTAERRWPTPSACSP